MYKYGLKIWSTNINIISHIQKLYDRYVFNYVELFAQPSSYNSTIKYWEKLNIPFIIHAPHSLAGLNPSLNELEKQNKILVDETLKFADKLNSNIIIFHPGVNGNIQETARQIGKWNDGRIIIENKPYLGLDNSICVGHSFDNIQFLINETKCGFCLDIGHATCSANSKDIDPLEYIKKFITLNPVMFHLSDGDYSGQTDNHINFGKGNYPLQKILSIIPAKSQISIETEKDLNNKLLDFEQDIVYLNSVIKNIYKIKLKKADKDDMDFVFNISNDPVVRVVSYNSDSIKYEDHIEWYKKIITDNDTIFLIIIVNEKRAGQARFSMNENRKKEATISISLSKEFRSLGIGKFIIEALHNYIGTIGINKIVAYVKEDNIASNKFFLKNGYKFNKSLDIKNVKSNEYIFKL